MGIIDRIKDRFLDWLIPGQQADQVEQTEPTEEVASGPDVPPGNVVRLRLMRSPGKLEYRTFRVGLSREEWEALSRAVMNRRGASPTGEATGIALRAFLQINAIVADPNKRLLIVESGKEPLVIYWGSRSS